MASGVSCSSPTEMSEVDWGISPELSDSECKADDADEYPLSLYFSETLPKLQYRKDASIARWDAKFGLAEVIDRKGKMWTTTGIVRRGKLLCHIEEVVFLVERGALLVLDDHDVLLSVENVYSLLAGAGYGCTWEWYQAYCHLKTLGYIVGRHNCSWSQKLTAQTSQELTFQGENGNPQGSSQPINSDVQIGIKVDACAQDLKNLKIHGAKCHSNHLGNTPKLVFDVYQPNANFRKSAPGLPDFILCIAREHPPDINDVRTIQESCTNIPVKYASIQCGRVNFFSFGAMELPVLP